MNTLATFFASIIALFSGLLGHTSPPTIEQQPVSNVATISETASSTISQNNTNSASTTTTSNSILSKESAKKILFVDKDNLIHIKNVILDGSINSGKFNGHKRVIVITQSDAWFEPGNENGEIVFILATNDFKTYILDKSLEYFYSQKDWDNTIFTNSVTATGTIPSNHPDNIELGSFVLTKGSPYTEIVSADARKVQSTVPGFIFYLAPVNVIIEDEFGMKYVYGLLPKETYESHKKQPDYNNPDYRNYYFNASEIKTNKPLYKTYGNAFPGACGYGGGSLSEVPNVKAENMQAIGTTTYGTTVYIPVLSTDTFIKTQYGKKVTSVTSIGKEEFKQLNGFMAPTFESYAEKNPVLFMKDSWGRWVAVGEWDYKLEGGCGKPVIYLYPKHSTEVSVKINVPTTFSTQIPSYNSGWKVLAHPDGTLKNLQLETTDCNTNDYNKIGSEYAKNACIKNSYPYLYWSGNVGADYPTVNNGSIIKRENLKNFLENKLTDIGFTINERNDFIEYWVPEMLKKEELFFRVSFITTQEMNRFIPMTVTPRPDSVYRLFMDWEPISKNPSKQLEEQLLPVIKRDGFTLIEWGGVHPK